MNHFIRWLIPAALIVICGFMQSALAQVPPAPGQFEFFEKKIRPVLVANCYECHSAGSKELKGGLLLDTREGVLQGGDRGAAIVSGVPEKSLLILAIRHQHDDPHLAMPPQKPKLAEEVLADFEQWVKLGAPDPRSRKTIAKPAKWDTAQAADHWAFKKITKPPVPNVADSQHFARNPIDQFILAKLRERSLAPSPPADKRTLIRRVTYDLIGLPPSAEEVDAFLADSSPGAYEKVIDQLLDSPRYGERWGRHWLDIARYSDTNGDRGGGARVSVYPFAWTYRDYVIEAFNQDLPFDRFILEQIAADRLPESQQDKMRLRALGFLTVGKRFMGNVQDMLDDRIDVVTRGLMGLTVACARCHDHKFDPISTEDYYALHGVFSSTEEPRDTAPLFDPAKSPEHADYLAEVAKIEQEVVDYGHSEVARIVSGMLENSGEYMLAGHQWLHRPDAKKENGQNYYGLRIYLKARPLLLELAYPWQNRLWLMEAEHRSDPVFSPWLKFAAQSEENFAEQSPILCKEISESKDVNPAIAKAIGAAKPTSLKAVAAVYTEVFAALREQLKLEKFHPSDKLPFNSAPTKRVLDDADFESLRQHLYGPESPLACDDAVLTRSQYLFPRIKTAIRSKVVSLDLTHPGAPVKAMAVADSAKPKNSAVFVRGEPENLGPVVPRRFLTVLSGEAPPPFTDGSGRLELAQAIVNRDNPLTARVLVNRVWQWHFGQALVRTVSDFGLRSEAPTHPEMLDWLSTWLMDHNWSLKQLHKLMLTSATYQQQSLARADGIERDATNERLWRFNLRRLDFEEIRDTLLVVGDTLDLTAGGPPFNLAPLGPNMAKPKYVGADFSELKNNGPRRRTVFALVDRSGLAEIFNTFDFADPDMSTGERILTTVPQQALFMMNSPLIAEQVRHLLARPGFPAQGSNDEKVRYLFRVLFQRAPRAEELQLAQRFLASAANDQDTAAGNFLSAWERYTQSLLLTNELLFVD